MRRPVLLAPRAVLATLALGALLGGAPACSRDEPRREAPPGARAPATTVVTLMPSGTEVVAALGAAGMLIGVDEYSEYPPEVNRLPKVGSFLAPNVEAIVRLAPSLVVVDDVHAPAAAALRDAGVETVACPLHALPDVRHALRAVGARLGKAAEAERVIREIDAALDAAAARRPARRPRVLAVIDRETGGLGGLVAAGPGSWVDELLAVVGGDNVMQASGVRYPKISLEEVLRGRPDVILDLSYAAHEAATAAASSSSATATAASSPATTSSSSATAAGSAAATPTPAALGPWRAVDVPATRTGRVIGLYRAYLAGPSPRVTQALADLARAIAPP